MRHLLEVDDLTAAELADVLRRAEVPDPPPVLDRRGVALLFAKPSLRTRHSAEMGVVGLGGHPITVRADEVGAGTREAFGDIARVLAGYHAVLGARVHAHTDLEELAAPGALPVVNLLSQAAHPCQALADLLTMRRELGELAGRTVAWVGDANNVARSVGRGAALSGMRIRFACPPGYAPSDIELDHLIGLGAADVQVTHRPHEAVDGADVVHTDVWTSMGDEAEAEARRRAFEGFMVDDSVMAVAAPGAIFMHCLPAHRGEEVAGSVIDGPASRVMGQAHDRLPAFRGLLWWLVEVNGPTTSPGAGP
ncbi:MAG: ornithine carbamoyltransferase [Acidimicrobiia bacterium]|nr:ornithine carbamoyltransferase [Acidimicrobiia bacterium]